MKKEDKKEKKGIKEKKTKKTKYMSKVKTQIKSHKKVFAWYVILRCLVIVVLILQLIHHNYENAFCCILILILFLLPTLFEMKLHVRMPDTLEIIILLFIFAGELLGEVQNFYNIIPYWDTILHTINGFLCAAIGISFIDILNQTDKFHLKLTPKFVAFFGFCFAMTIGVIWEFMEFGFDYFFRSDMQKDRIVYNISSVLLNESGENVPVKINDIEKTVIYSKDGKYTIDGYLDIGLIDTIKDLLVSFIGAIVFSIMGYYYVKNRKNDKFVNEFIIYLKPEKE